MKKTPQGATMRAVSKKPKSTSSDHSKTKDRHLSADNPKDQKQNQNLNLNQKKIQKITFTQYEKLIIALLAFIQFTVVLGFMIMAPLGTILMETMHISPSEFSLLVAVYAVSAGTSALVSSVVADNFDRKKYMLFFYTGFVIGTFLCGLAPTYETLLAARVVSGLFGGVIASISLAIIADLFPYQVRGRVMGYIMAAFSVSQVMGLPLGMFIATHWDWHLPFIIIGAMAVPVGFLILFRMKPITGHLGAHRDQKVHRRMLKIFFKKNHVEAFAATALLTSGGFMLMPFASTFSEHNLGLTRDQISLVYFATGIASMFAGIIAGYLSDMIGKYAMFVWGSIIAVIITLYYTRLGLTPLWVVIGLSAILFVGVSARMVSAQALMSAVPDAPDRGSFMALNASVQQYSGAIASIIAGLIVIQTGKGELKHYEILGYVVSFTMLATALFMYRLHVRFAERGDEPPLEFEAVVVDDASDSSRLARR